MIGQNLRIVSILQIMFEQLRGVLNKEVCVMSRLREKTIVTVKQLWRWFDETIDFIMTDLREMYGDVGREDMKNNFRKAEC